MKIEFEAIGLKFRASVAYTAGEPNSRDELGWPSECDILTLDEIGSGKPCPAAFLMRSDVAEQIAEAAHQMADKVWPDYVAGRKAEAAIDRAEARKDWSAA